MPELPEVEMARRRVGGALVGRKINAVRLLDPRLFTGPPHELDQAVVGRTVRHVGRRGKVLILALDPPGSLLIHLKMTGQLVVLASGSPVAAGGHSSPHAPVTLPGRSTRAVFEFDQDVALYFNDSRRFGWLRVAGASPCSCDPFLSRLGPEPLGDAFTLAALRGELQRHGRAVVKAVLLDQSVVAGLGNIYVDEALHRARIHPARRAGSLDEAETRELHAAIRQVLRDSIDVGGTTIAGYVNQSGPEGGFLARADVFRRAGAPCRACGAALVRTVVAGRGTVYCPVCQAV